MRIKKTIFTMIVMLICAAPVLRAEVIDRIVVVVNDEAITQREIDRILEPVYEQYRGLYYGDELIKKLDLARAHIVDQLIEDRLLFGEAKREGIEVPDQEIEERLNESRSRFSDGANFEKALGEQNLTIADVRKRYKEQLMVKKLIDKKVGSKIYINPTELRDYYLKHSNDFVQPEEVKLSNILIRPKRDVSLQDAYKKAQEILRRIKEGGDFAGLAIEYSEGPNAKDGGSMGYVKKGDLLPEIEEIVFKMEPGQISDIVQSKLGYHIFRVEEKHERRALEFNEVYHEVEAAIYREKAKEKIKGWIDKLKKNAYIEYK